jgi:hypothetical protein
MNTRVCLSLLTAVALAVTGCRSTPTSPSSPGGASSAPRIEVMCPEFGESFRCSAYVMSSSNSQDVTGLAQWSTSSPAIATVSSTGLVTVVGAGEVSIRASYQGASGYAIVSVAPGQGISGTYRDLQGTVLSLEGPLPDVLMEILTGPNAGRRTTTSSTGWFSMTGLQDGQFTIRLSKTGYITAEYVWSIPGGRERTPTLTKAK